MSTPEPNSSSSEAADDFESFAILTPRLILLPTPIAVSILPYRRLYSELHSDAAFCEMGFGAQFPVEKWDDDRTREVIETRDIALSWKALGLGDFAVALRPSSDDSLPSLKPEESTPTPVVIRGAEFDQLAGPSHERFSDLIWVGYAGVRDAKTTSLRAQDPRELAALPPWYEMAELRYGISPKFWGAGFAKEAAEAVMKWSVSERGVRRFIAETERENQRSGRVLSKLGFTLSGMDYWKEPGEIEWECVIG